MSTLAFPHIAFETMVTIVAVVMIAILGLTSFFRGNVPGFLAAAYCLLLTIGCAVIFHRSASHSQAVAIAIQAPVSRQVLTGVNGRPCNAVISSHSEPIAVREIICIAGAGADCTATLDVPANRASSLLAADQSLRVIAVAACP